MSRVSVRPMSLGFGAYVVVENPGTDEQCEVADFPRFRDAALFRTEWYDESDEREVRVDIMKRLPDGSLTTEF